MYSLMSRYYSELFPLTLDKLSFAQKLPYAGKTYRILDIGCSTGDLCLALAKDNHKLIGIDLDEMMIHEATERLAQYPDLTVDYRTLNMLDLEKHFPEKHFHQILCLGNTIVHLTELNQIYSLFRQVFKILKTSGSFKGQILNYSYLMANKIKSLPLIETEHIRFERNYIYDNNIVHFQTILKDKTNNTKHKRSIPLYPLSSDLMEELLSDVGFQDIEFYGSFNLEPYQSNSSCVVFEARK